ncbi:FkbM family methyltransferase [Actinokineospora sp. G85]|uniref:FkbM family methyltransferase n=1 Tax=Actinokineospora sp. G85 TaxID=3406626 RepID=UPI003C73F569
MADVAQAPVLTACTVVDCAGLPAARITARTFREQHPGARFTTLLVDGADPDDTDVITPADLGFGEAELAVLATGHSTAEACAALRPLLLEHLLEQGEGAVLHLGPRVRVLAPLTDVVDALAQAPVVLVPKVLRPLPADGLRPTPADLLAAGVYDAGLLAVAPGAEPFLRAWAEASRTDPDRAAAFLDGAPALVDHRVLRDPGLNLSRWNAGQRPLTRGADGAHTTAGVPLRTIDLTGFDPRKPWLLTADYRDNPRVLLSENVPLNRLCADYAAELADTEPPEPTLRFAARTDGPPFPAPMRRAFRAEQPPAAGVDPAGFLRWACAAPEGAPDATRWAQWVWEDDPDLRQRFPEPFGADAAAYRDWCATDAALSGRLPQRAVPGQTADVALVDQIGVSVLGSGPLADRLRMAAAASGLPVSAEPVYPVVLAPGGLVAVPRQRHVIAVRDEHGPVPARADERWLVWPAVAPAPDGVATHTVPLPLADPGARDEVAADDARRALGLDRGPVLVALGDRADDLLAAFRAAFPQRDDVRLVLLVPDELARTEAAERLRLSVAREPRVRLITEQAGFRHATDAATWALSLHHPGEPGGAGVNRWLTDLSLRGVPLVTITGGTAAELLGGDNCVVLPVDEFAADTMVAGAIRDLADDQATADKVGSAARTHLLEVLAPAAAGEVVRRRVELAYRSWRAGRALASATEDDPLRALRTARHALLRRPDTDVGYKIPMAPQMRRAVLRVLAHYDSHLTSVLSSLIDGIERTAVELVERQEKLAAPDVDLLRADLDLVVERSAAMGRQVTAANDEIARLRGDVVSGSRALNDVRSRLREAAAPAAPPPTDEVRRLTEALEASTARMDALEARLAEREARAEAGSWSADQALRATDALRRVFVRQQERANPVRTESSLVLCDAGLLRLPARDSIMSAVLSSNGVWEPDVAELVDSLIEPDSVFLDVGAYVGYHSIRVLSRLGTSGTVVAVEPDADAVELLRHNVSENVPESVGARLGVLPVAGWDSPAKLVGTPAAGGGLAIAEHVPENVTGDTGDDVAVPGVRLDRELDALEVARGQRLGLVKVDIPGLGHRALGGLARRLRKDRPHVVFTLDAALTSGNGADPSVVLREFRTWGYELVRLGDTAAVEVDEVVSEVLAGRVRTLWLRPSATR